MASAKEFSQFRLKFIDPSQSEYEVIRPIVLFSTTIAERGRQTDLERRRIGENSPVLSLDKTLLTLARQLKLQVIEV